MGRTLTGLALGLLATACMQLETAPSDDAEAALVGVDTRLAPLAWLVGTWRAEAFGGQVEETWLPPVGDSMHGVFRAVGDGSLRFAEFLQVTAEEAGVVLRFAHFRPNYSTWEDGPLQLRLASATDTELVFEAHAEGSPDRIVYRLQGDELHVTISGLDGDLRFRRDG
ncbi:MAG: DUF6265 family protein [Planctomycetota bacterium]|nr:DUF6265 family protein [Planctomycetota bacterium]